MKTVCMFCMKSHTKKPKLCDAKSKVMRAYLYQGLQLWQVMHGVETGIINLEAEALQVVHNSKKRSKK